MGANAAKAVKSTQSAAKSGKAAGKIKAGFSPIGLLVLGVLTATAFVSPPVLIVLGVGMLPTFVAWLVDQTPGRLATWTVAGANACGVVPFLPKVWVAPKAAVALTQILSDTVALTTMLGAAAVGWGAHYGCQVIARAIGDIAAEHRINRLRGEQQALLDQWGPSITQAGRLDLEEADNAMPDEGTEPAR